MGSACGIDLSVKVRKDKKQTLLLRGNSLIVFFSLRKTSMFDLKSQENGDKHR